MAAKVGGGDIRIYNLLKSYRQERIQKMDSKLDFVLKSEKNHLEVI